MTKINDFNLQEKIEKKQLIGNDDDRYDVGLIEKAHRKYNMKAVITSKMRLIDSTNLKKD